MQVGKIIFEKTKHKVSRLLHFYPMCISEKVIITNDYNIHVSKQYIGSQTVQSKDVQ
jgi:hypothetical protein